MSTQAASKRGAAATSDPATLDTSLHAKRRAARMEDPAFAREYERQATSIAAVDRVVAMLDEVRVAQGMSKADLARKVGKSPAHIRRLLTGAQAPTLTTIAQVASSLGYELAIAPTAKPGKAGGRGA